MKTILLLFLTTILMNSTVAENKYQQAMNNAIEKLNQSTSTNEFLEAANTFERICSIEQSEWLPYYYAAYSYIMVSYQEQDLTKKDPILDKAQQFLDKAFKIAPEESELFTLQAFLYPGRMLVDPMARGMEYMGIMNQAIETAIRLNPENPRSYYLRAITVLNMPENFGGGAAVAKPIFEEAKVKFDKFQPESTISPVWGKEQNELEISKL
jgi:hypothetical protein